ncbi:hypothetical protein JOD18_001224 [Gracilibacillus alcaliphilus]|nr:hypothetical protein [Gracilibacillus alcaliphilus]
MATRSGQYRPSNFPSTSGGCFFTILSETKRYLWGCKNYQKQKRKVAKLQEKVANQRADFCMS